MMDGIPEGIGNSGQLMLQAIQLHFEITRFTQRSLPPILLVEIAGIGLSLDLEELSRAFRLIAAVMMVGNVTFGQTSAARLLQRRT